MRDWKKRWNWGLVAFAIGATIYGGSKPIPVADIGADDGIVLAGITADYDATNDVSAIEVAFTGNSVTTATPVSVRNAETEQWRELAKIGATITSDLPTNILAFATAGNATTNRFWWVGTNTPPVVVTTEGITITNFVASSHSVHIAWTCDDPKATQFAIQRRRKGAPVGVPYDIEVEYLESTGRQWIDTEVQTADKVQMDVWVNSVGGDMKIWGNSYYLGRWADISWYQAAYRGTQIPQVAQVWDIITIEKSPLRLTIERDGATYTTSSWWSANGTSSDGNAQYGTAVPLFAHTNPYGTWYGADCVAGWGQSAYRLRNSFFKAWRNGVIISDRIAVRIGSTGYMYDRVSGRLFGNKGRGSFAFGADNPWETIGTTTGNSLDFIGFTVGESWEWRITSTYTEGE